MSNGGYGICPECGSIPSSGLGATYCPNCPGQDSGKWCTYRTVGAIIRNPAGEILLFNRGTYPFCIAGPAGHCDDGDAPQVAIEKEIREEVGLEVLCLQEITQLWCASRCRRRHTGEPGHWWTFYHASCLGEVRESQREVSGKARFYTESEIKSLMQSTARGSKRNALDEPWYMLFSRTIEM